MKTKITFLFTFLLLVSFSVRSQMVDTVRSLVITEAMTIDSPVSRSYVELTNMGSAAINLSNFELGANAWTLSLAFHTPPTHCTRLPDVMLQPGETYVIAYVRDFAEKRLDLNLPRTWPIIWEKADLQVHEDEGTAGTNEGLDSISKYYGLLPYGGGWAIYLEYHAGGDSAVVDGVFLHIDPVANRIDGTNVEKRGVAGIPLGWGAGNVIVRKTTVTQGVFNWDDSRGTNAEESGWMVIPPRQTGGGAARFFTTIGHHGNVTLNSASVSSEKITVDWANSVMEVPWGIYKDSIMSDYTLADGIGWHYRLSPDVEDSTHRIAVTGDTLIMYGVGESAHRIDFAIVQQAPAANMNLVFPKNLRFQNAAGNVGWSTPFYVTENQPVIDTVGSIEFRTRVDTLFKYLDKAENASWEIVWVDGIQRSDVKQGDILKVTAFDGSIKNYFLDVDDIPEPSHNAGLSAITWPDAPEYFRQNPAWNDDTIPGFNANKLLYNVTLPYGTTNVPAFKAVPANLNARVTENRAVLLSGTVSDRTTSFEVTAEDDTTIRNYSVVFSVEKLPDLIQPFTPDPFISEIVRKEWRQNSFIEITNPGNQPLDLSNYLIIRGWLGQAPSVFFANQKANYNNRFMAYIPGYEYQSLEEWTVNPDIIIKDLSVNPILDPGETFVLAYIESGAGGWAYNSMCDVIWTGQNTLKDDPATGGTQGVKVFNRRDYGMYANNMSPAFLSNTAGAMSVSIYKIMNDSIKNGTKALGDLNDFELIDVFGTYDGVEWAPGGVPLGTHNTYIRRKAGFWKGATLPGINGSWGASNEESEWYYDDWFGIQAKLGLPTEYSAEPYIGENIGLHAMDEVTVYLSTIASYVYKVSDGYVSPQTINGVLPDTKVTDLLLNINKNDAGQILTVIGKEGESIITANDTLMVTSADGVNVTKYVMSIGALNSDAVLTSSVYTISTEGSTRTISGIPVGTSIQEVRANVTKPQSAMLNIIDANDRMVSMQVRNFDTVYVNTQATNNIFFEVIAENGVTIIKYQLQLNLLQSDAFVFSDLYDVNQEARTISLIPGGIRVQEFFNYLTGNEGAVLKLYDKEGLEVLEGNVAYDDVVIVSSPDGTSTKVYVLDFLNEPKGMEAYVVSDVLNVNQLETIISSIQPGLDLNTFYNLVTAAPGSTMTILDAGDLTKTTGQIVPGDQLKVVSGDGQLTVIYTLTLTTGVNPDAGQHAIRVYPNPAQDVVFVEGINGSSVIEVRNILGALVKLVKTENSDLVSIPMNELSSGIYFLNIRTKANNQNITLKVVKK